MQLKPIWRLSMSRLSLGGNEDRSRGQMCDIFVSLPVLPKFRSTGSLAVGVSSDQRNSLPNARSPAPLLVSALPEVGMQMHNICDPRPMLLNNLELACKRGYG